MVKKNTKNFANGLIVSGDLTDGEKVRRFFASGLIVMGDLPK